MKYKVVLLLLVSMLLCSSWSFAGEYQGIFPSSLRSQAAISAGFDFFETFDDLNDWKESVSGRRSNYWTPGLALPVRSADSSVTGWSGYYSNTFAAKPYCIADQRNQGGLVWRGSKSMAIDLRTNDPVSVGTNDIRFYIGNGSATQGYEEVYVFYMVYVPRNSWPTDHVDDVWSYQDGHNYFGNLSWKHFWWGTGMDGSLHNAFRATVEPSATIDDYYHFYSMFSHGIHILPNAHQPVNNGPIGNHVEIQQDMAEYWGCSDASTPCNPRVYAGGVRDCPDGSVWETHNPYRPDVYWGQVRTEPENIIFPLDQWVGVELRLKLGSDDPNCLYVGGTCYGQLDIWTYAQDGISHLMYTASNIPMKLSCTGTGIKINEFWFGGNNSATFGWGPTMTSAYYVDDFIIDKDRIGPRYFSMIGGRTATKGTTGGKTITKGTSGDRTVTFGQ